MFGEPQLLRTCLTLAIRGKPALTCLPVIDPPNLTTPVTLEELSQLQSQNPEVEKAYKLEWAHEKLSQLQDICFDDMSRLTGCRNVNKNRRRGFKKVVT